MNISRRAELIAIWKGRCAYCSVLTCLHPNRFQSAVEHCEPLSRGGEDTPENTVLSCNQCNASKERMFLLEWIFQQNGLIYQAGKEHRLSVATKARPESPAGLYGRQRHIAGRLVVRKDSLCPHGVSA